MAFEGANPDQLDSLADQFNSTAQRLEDIRANVTRRLGYSSWKGPAADRFRHQWTTSARSIDATASALRQAQKILHDNANQQRSASGEGTAASGGGLGGLFGQLLHDAENIVRAEVKAAHDVVSAVAHGAEAVVAAEVKFAKDAWDTEVKGFHELGQVISKDWDDFVKSPVFDDIMVGLRVVAAVAPFIAVVCPAFAVVAVVANVLILAGDAAKMANTGHWDLAALGVDAAGVALSGVGLSAVGVGGAALKTAVSQAGEMSAFTKGGAEAISAGNMGAKAIFATKTVGGALDIADHAGKMSTDLSNQDYGAAALDGVGMVSGAIGYSGVRVNGELNQAGLEMDGALATTDADLAHDHSAENGDKK